MDVHTGYQPARSCTTGPQPGARGLMAWFLGAHRNRGGTNLGIFNCRAVRGGTTTSLHGEGRACDLGVAPHGAGWGDELAEQLRVNSAELGIQCVIWNRRIWSGSRPHAGWRPYAGLNPHRDHLHVELSWHAARTLTAARVAQVLGTAAVANPVRATQQAVHVDVDGAWGPVTDRAVSLVRHAATGEPFHAWDVRAGQAAVGTRVDGDWGPASKAALSATVKRLQAAWGAAPDGHWGPVTDRAYRAARERHARGL